MNQKVNLFQSVFCGREPRILSCTSVLERQQLNFDKFKLLYGVNQEQALRNVKMGDQQLEVNLKDYTYKKVVVETVNHERLYKETEASKIARAQKFEARSEARSSAIKQKESSPSKKPLRGNSRKDDVTLTSSEWPVTEDSPRNSGSNNKVEVKKIKSDTSVR